MSPEKPESEPHVASAAATWPPLRRFIDGEHRLGLHMARRRWTAAIYEFLRFGVKQGWACRRSPREGVGAGASERIRR